MLDEGLLGEDDEGKDDGIESGEKESAKRRSDGKLRFSVVIGVV